MEPPRHGTLKTSPAIVRPTWEHMIDGYLTNRGFSYKREDVTAERSAWSLASSAGCLRHAAEMKLADGAITECMRGLFPSVRFGKPITVI